MLLPYACLLPGSDSPIVSDPVNAKLMVQGASVLR